MSLFFLLYFSACFYSLFFLFFYFTCFKAIEKPHKRAPFTSRQANGKWYEIHSFLKNFSILNSFISKNIPFAFLFKTCLNGKGVLFLSSLFLLILFWHTISASYIKSHSFQKLFQSL